MKKTLILGALLAGALGANAQGTVNFADEITGFTMHIYGPQSSGLAVQGNNAVNDNPLGSTAYDAGSGIGGSASGTGLGNGNNISVELYALAGAGQALSSLQPISQYTGHGGIKAAAVGLFVPSTISGADPGIPGGYGPTTVALYAWFNGGGTYSTLALAEAGGQDWGSSAPVTLTALGDALGSPPTTSPAIGVTSFSIQSVPEPSTIALGVMGASAFLLRRRTSK
jgi:hypothetical protein